MSDIFLSYAREDRETAEALAAAFKKRGWSVWWDREILTGNFSFQIEEALAAAKCVVVLWSKDSVKSEWVRNEATEGSSRGVLVPVRIARVKVPLAFSGLQTPDLIDWRGDVHAPGFEDVCRAIDATVGRPSIPTPPPPPPPPHPLPPPPPPWFLRSRSVLLALIPVVALVTVLAATGLIRSGDEDQPGPRPLRVAVDADVEWARAVEVDAGETVEITAKGEIDTATDLPGRTSGPDGIAGEEYHENNVIAGVAHAALIGKLGEGGTPMLVGSFLRYTAPTDGVLFLGVNDRGLANNGGRYDVTIG